MLKFFEKICALFTDMTALCRKGKIFFGRDPAGVSAPALVILPLSRHTLCCGLAGILAIAKPAKPAPTDIYEEIKQVFAEICRRDLRSQLEQGQPIDDYLFADPGLARLEELINCWKREENAEVIFYSPEKRAGLHDLALQMKELISREEAILEQRAGAFPGPSLEIIAGRLIVLKDAAWELEKDILGNVGPVMALAGQRDHRTLSPPAFRKYRRINFLLNALDRLEVRGRDSAGIDVAFVVSENHYSRALKNLADKNLLAEYELRRKPGELKNFSIGVNRCSGDGRSDLHLTFTYKTSSIVGELGRNVRELRRFISDDAVLHEFCALEASSQRVVTHTRWASVGTITESNCHPLNNFSLPGANTGRGEGMRSYPRYGRGNWSIHAVLNGDIDNYQVLRESLESEGVVLSPELTTDAKIITLVIERYLLAGHDLETSIRLAVNEFEGSQAIAVTSNLEPGKVYLALRGSGQSLYIGLAQDSYIFASEIYGLVEGTRNFLRMDGEKTRPARGKEGSGQLFVLNEDTAGGLQGISARFYDGSLLTLTEKDIKKAEITTRDIDRGDYAHYFLKEINESAASVRKTLRGKYVISSGETGGVRVAFNLGRDVIPEELEKALKKGNIAQIMVIGHGTAAVAGSVVADGFKRYLAAANIIVEAQVASELSGFSLRHDLKDTLVMPITQSGTTTDTNRAVAMARERGAFILSIVNRRQSDITAKSHGVFYTSDGRDIEMSVASTKAFYSQIVAGHVLALCMAQLLKTQGDDFIAAELKQLEEAPSRMCQVLARREEIRQSAANLIRQRNQWAVVGSGPNRAAAEEIRIKLSELCYKTIAADVVENKKHIDLSAEPLVIVCAAGTPEAVTADMVKDVAIFKAHKSAVVVFAQEGEDRFQGIADSVIQVPASTLPLSVILNTLAGHLWGYYAACAIDEDALFLREFRGRLNLIMEEQQQENVSFYERLYDRNLKRQVREFTRKFHELRSKGAFSYSQVKTIADLALLLKYASGKLPLDDFWNEFNVKRGSSPLDYLDLVLGQAVDELSRPIDAIRHQAKTVTVGTSRKEEPFRGPIFELLGELGFTQYAISSKNMMLMERIQRALDSVRGYTLYEIENLDQDGNPQEETTIRVSRRGGVSLTMRSRAETPRELMGTKRTIASTGRIWVGHGKLDGAPVVIIPLYDVSAVVKNILLIHVTFNENLALKDKMALLGHRLNDLHNLINEYNLPWQDRYLDLVPLGFLLGEPVEAVAGKIREQLGSPSQAEDVSPDKDQK